ncbi:hypothetical protein SAMN05192533_101415 [Mesobacillus persicus]|uniref:Uncharacterized protein n=1 Tax=Mesobacillus persicus TaxID=930146 RepID=A0A1H7WGR1_9BACI|nr:hypothetical protein SAMN05192533_101415 [Mesobacillus persicus]
MGFKFSNLNYRDVLITSIFYAIWIGITLPISISLIFWILKPLIIKDTTGISMIILAMIVAPVVSYLGMKLFQKKIKPWFKK